MNIYKKLRLDTGLKVVDASKELEIAPSYLWSIESGRRKPGRDLIVRMCDLYNCKLEDIFLPNAYTKCIGI